MKNTQTTTFIYTIERDNVRYIGKSNRPRRRLYQHMSEKKNLHKYNWLNQINGKKPKIQILDEVPMDDWEYWEIYWIEQFKSWGFELLNATDGGEGANGYSHTEESKQKMGKSRIGIPLSEEHKKKISDSIKLKSQENPSYNMKGKNARVPMDRDLLYQTYITKNMSIPELSKHFEVSEKKIFDELHRYSIKKEDGWWLKGLSDKYKKPVLQYDLDNNLIKEWKGVVDIGNELGFNKGNIASCCRGLIHTSMGFIWKYKVNI